MIIIIEIIMQIFQLNEWFILFHVIILFKLNVFVFQKICRLLYVGGHHNLLSA